MNGIPGPAPVSSLVLLHIDPADAQLLHTMTRASAPRWMRLAGCLALEGRTVVLIRDGWPVLDRCAVCTTPPAARLFALHKAADGGDKRALVACPRCGRTAENRPLALIEGRPENRLSGITSVF